MNITVVGLGLIGASLAKAISARSEHRVIGIDINEDTLKKALNDKTIDKIGNADDLADSDLTIVSLYPQAVIDFVKQNAEHFKRGATVIDTCGIKRNICSELVPFCKQHGFEFIGAHPMAGKEKNGYDYSEETLFDNAFMILTPIDADEMNMQMLKNLSAQIGFKNVTVTNPQEHDRIIAYTSQIPHVLACCYINDPDARLHSGFSAGSYRDISRVADINAALWCELFLENGDYLTRHIDLLIKYLTDMRDMISDGDENALLETLKHAKEMKSKIG